MNEWFILGFFTIVVLIPVIAGVWGSIVEKKLKLREKELDVLGSQTAEKAAQYAAQTERLEQRVRVLEQIVTDKGFDTATQIDALRQARLEKREQA